MNDKNSPNWLDCQMNLFKQIGEKMLKKNEGKNFFFDTENYKVIEFLIYYFNNDKRAEEVFLNKKYKLNKSILIVGALGVGKNTIMDIFQRYITHTNETIKSISTMNYEEYKPLATNFEALDMANFSNYYKAYNNYNIYAYNLHESIPKPKNICLNDIGAYLNDKHYGNSMYDIINNYLMTRCELFRKYGKKLHLTSNLFMDDLISTVFDERTEDKMRNSYNEIVLVGSSKR